VGAVVKVSVLGGAGFIGAHIVERLVADGHKVTVVDVAWPSWREPQLDGAYRMCADLTDPRGAREAVAGQDWVFHFAADVGGAGYFHSDADLDAAMANGEMTTNVFRAVAFEDVARTFYASSACAYPVELQSDVNTVPLLAESSVGMGTPEALYGAEKLHGLRLAAKVPGVRVGIQHAIYGPGMDWDGGRRVKFPASVARKALAAATTGSLELWGDGTQRRTYLHIDDAVDRIMAVMSADVYHGPVNIGASGAVSCRQIAELCLTLVGADADIVTNPAEPSGVMARDCDNTEFVRRYGDVHTRTYPGGFWSLINWLRTVIDP
jgi:nucleoside-diphosphate-sugar epimerase